MLIRRVLRASRIGVWHPDRFQVQDVGKYVVGQRSADIRQDSRLPADGARERAAGPSHPWIGRVEAAGVEVSTLHLSYLDVPEAMAIEMTTQRRDDVVDPCADHVAKLAVRPCDAGNGVHGTLRCAGVKGQNLKTVPAENAFGGCQAGLAPVAVDLWSIGAAVDLDARQGLPHGRRQGWPPFR